MKIILVVGARPNFMKVAPLWRAISETNRNGGGSITSVLVHTGQHYDAALSDAFFADLHLPDPDVHLGVGSASHACQTAEIMRKFEGVLENERPDAVIVVGDVNSTVACALVTAKMSFDAGGSRPLLAHVEAGLRSFDRTMPEECNRVVTDQLSDLLFVTEESGLRNLRNEGIPPERVFFVGNTMIDSLLGCEKRAESSSIVQTLGLQVATANGSPHNKRYVLLTLHRPANVDNRGTFLEILEGLRRVDETIIFPAHPRTQKKIQQHRLESYFDFPNGEVAARRECRAGIRMINPLGYLDFLCLMKNATLVVTDSGGIQEETTCLGVPCVTVRENTERPITVTAGTNILGGTRRESIRAAISRQLQRTHRRSFPEKWDGKAGARIVEVLQESLRRSLRTSEERLAAPA